MFCNYNIQCEKIKPYNEKQEKRKGRTIEIEKKLSGQGSSLQLARRTSSQHQILAFQLRQGLGQGRIGGLLKLHKFLQKLPLL